MKLTSITNFLIAITGVLILLLIGNIIFFWFETIELNQIQVYAKFWKEITFVLILFSTTVGMKTYNEIHND